LPTRTIGPHIDDEARGSFSSSRHRAFSNAACKQAARWCR